MKTNVNMIRKMGDFEVVQRTKDGMFNATGLLKQWNQKSGQQKTIGQYFDVAATKQIIEALKTDSGITTSAESQIFTKVRGGKVQGTWMTPLLFIDFAMWLNPSFKVKVLKFVYDELIKYRNDAGDAYREMASAIAIIVPKRDMAARMQDIAKALNHIVYGTHKPGVRNTEAEENKARELYELERDVAKLINRGFIKTYDELIRYLRSEWKAKHLPKVLR